MPRSDRPQNERRRDPTPLEIRKACAEIRRGWSEEEHRARAAGLAGGRVQSGPAEPWEFPSFSVTSANGAPVFRPSGTRPKPRKKGREL